MAENGGYKNIGALVADTSGAIAIGPFGSAMKADTYTSSGVRVIRGTNIGDTGTWKGDWVFVPDAFVDKMPRCEVRAGDLVFPHRGSIGEVAIVPDDGHRYCLSTSLMKATLDPSKADPLFVCYYLKSPAGRQEIMRFGSQVGTPGIGQPLASLRQFNVPNPDVTTQRAVVAVLSVLDDKIELNRRMNEALEGMAQAIFRDWFVDFGPTRRKVAGEADPVTILGGLTPDRAGAAKLAALFPAAFGDDGLPLGWMAGTLDRLALVNPESWKTKNHPAQVEYVDLSNTKWGTIAATSILAWEAAPSRARRIARIGDTIVGTVRPGNGSYAYIGRDGYTASTGFAVLRPKQAIYTDAIYVAATAADNITRLANLADGHGGAYPAVNPDVVAATSFPVVPDDLLAAFSAFASPLRAKVEQAKLENQTLAETRDYLLPRLMSGAVRVTPKVEAA